MHFRRRTNPARSTRRTSALIAISVVAVAVLPGAALSSAQAASTWQSGVYTGECGKSPLSKFGTWRHATVKRTSGYINGNSWADMAKLSGLGHCLAHDGVPITLSVAMLPGSTGDLRHGASGSYNQYWRAFGKSAVSSGFSHATLRIGWEMNGSWFKWSAAKDPTHWKLYWQQIVKTLRKVPGAHFTFEWSPGLGANSNFATSRAYPGDAYVTYIGSSIYDLYYGSSSDSAAKRWSHLNRERYGLTWLASFAKKHHKRIGISEWGLASKSSFSGHGNGDDAYFISHFYAWMKKHHVAYDIYFNRQHQANDHRIAIGTKTNSTFTKAGASYRKTFGGL